ncbi:MAG: aspartate carbamoyltransferase [Clostridia bacterium]|nr:aspartate carbamoyltransferase [Clostridia bacterium]NLS85767.1 aspartate carbamoyltransferase [Oscillospiraceae bacterium]
MRHLMEPFDLSIAELNTLLQLGESIAAEPAKYAHECDGKILATLFYEPSTRTRLSFESAMLRMGGKVLGFSSASSSSAAKGETVADTIRMVSGYADICAMRHPLEGAPFRASLFSRIPVINAGDGGHEHPTQTLTDLLTIKSRMGRLTNLRVGFCGDLKYGRTVHSLMKALARYEGNEFVLISPDELKVPAHILENEMAEANVPCIETKSLEDAIPTLDILYMTRIQKERFTDMNVYDRVKDIYILDEAKMALAKEKTAVLHPLPRVNEIKLAVDNDSRAAYFQQAQNGVYVRMALMLTLLGLAPSGKLDDKPSDYKLESTVESTPCTNRRCITSTEEELLPLYKKDANGVLRCIYCEKKLK